MNKSFYKKIKIFKNIQLLELINATSKSRTFRPSCSSSDEDDYQRDFQLRQDIHQLERALNNYDTKFDRTEAEHKLRLLKVRSDKA